MNKCPMLKLLMDPIDPPSSNKRIPSWLKDTLEDAEGHTAPREHSVKVRSQIGTNGT